jgi:type II secretory pathway component PulF
MTPDRILNSNEAAQLGQRVALVAASGLPLAAGLRAAARESGAGRVAAALEGLAEQVQRGSSLDEALSAAPVRLPGHVRGLLAAAGRSGDLGGALVELVEYQRVGRELTNSLWSSLAYPLLIVGLALLVLVFLVQFVAGSFAKMFDDFQLQLPAATELLMWWYRNGTFAFVGAAVVGILAAVAIWLGTTRASRLRLYKAVPLLGPLWRWAGWAEWSGLLSVLVRRQVPLAEALRLAADGMSDADMGQLSLQLAEGVGRGQSLSQLAAVTRRLPSSLVPLLHWGEQTGVLADALAAGRAMFESRLRTRAWLLQSILPPIVFIAVGSCFLFVIGALFLPLVSMIQGLS